MSVYRESKMQQRCVAWFRTQYPHYGKLLTHVANEGDGDRTVAAIRKAEGVVRGVPDLLLFMPAKYWRCHRSTFALGIEMKTAKGSQSQWQKDYQRLFEAAGYGYVIVKSFEAFQEVVNEYIGCVPETIRRDIAGTHIELKQEEDERVKEQLRKFLGKDI